MALSAADQAAVEAGGVTAAERNALSQTADGRAALAKIDATSGKTALNNPTNAAKKKQSEVKYDANQAHPKIEYKGTYPNLRVTQHPDGSQKLHSIEPGKESLFHIHGSGSYTGFGPLGQVVSVVMNKMHNYVADGHSQTVDGHHDKKVSGGTRKSVDGGKHEEVGGNKYAGGGGSHVSGSRDSQMKAATSGDNHGITEGNESTDHTGNVNKNITGNVITNIKGLKGEMVTGESFLNIQSGNYDVKVAKKIKIEAQDEIELRVGGNTLNLYKNGIAIQSDGGFMNIYVINSKGNLAISNKGDGKTGIFAENNEMILSGKFNKIASATGTKLESGTVPPVGQIKPK